MARAILQIVEKKNKPIHFAQQIWQTNHNLISLFIEDTHIWLTAILTYGPQSKTMYYYNIKINDECLVKMIQCMYEQKRELHIEET